MSDFSAISGYTPYTDSKRRDGHVILTGVFFYIIRRKEIYKFDWNEIYSSLLTSLELFGIYIYIRKIFVLTYVEVSVSAHVIHSVNPRSVSTDNWRVWKGTLRACKYIINEVSVYIYRRRFIVRGRTLNEKGTGSWRYSIPRCAGMRASSIIITALRLECVLKKVMLIYGNIFFCLSMLNSEFFHILYMSLSYITISFLLVWKSKYFHIKFKCLKLDFKKRIYL